MLSVRDLAHSYGRREVLRGVSFDVVRGETFGLLGPNGSGKSTALAILSGVLNKTGAGTITFDGRTLLADDREFRRQVGVVFQSPGLDLKLTARENLNLAAMIRGVPGRERKQRVEEQLERAGLADRAGDAVETYSGGMKRRLDIARALIDRPRVLLMDEPTAGLDEAAFRSTWQRLDDLRAARGDLTIIVATHRVDEADRCDRLAVLSEGRVGVIDTPDGLRRGLSGDIIALTGHDLAPLGEDIAKRFSVDCLAHDGEILITCESGHALIPRLVEAYPAGRFETVSLRHPSLADAFLKITGKNLDDDDDLSMECAT
ncbi:MAG: ABC transporter ATP-binding protein [Alphaproteobacteria bacterium]|uniref:ABC transporter ATP-binding protein n=1 Tax=Candidatus Nitrobium versatile TaxID=2884831 RepID=A0A953J4N2_9BACT|nr:ABC transporter ATP-binding protein [Candidatus Nitrobium versatile]